MGVQRWRLKPGFIASQGEPQRFEQPELNQQPEPIDQPEQLASDAAQYESVPAIQNPTDSALITMDSPSTIAGSHSDAQPEAKLEQPGLEELGWQGLQELLHASHHCPSCAPHNSVLGVGNSQAD